ncbi:MAG: LysR substrate-binding domain-containing protein [Pseudomonadota bacterium]
MTQEPLRQAFLEGMSHAAATVNVVTTDGPAGRGGLTVSAMTSVSADTKKPTLLVCVHHGAAAAPVIRENGVMAINLLRDDQSFISDTFAGRFKDQIDDRFDCADWLPMASGSPRVIDPLVAFDCKIISDTRIGTHHVLVGEVTDIFTADRGTPLIYANRAYGRTARIDPVTSLSTGRMDTALRIGCLQSFAPLFIPAIVARFAQSDATDLRLVEGDHRRLIEGLRAGDIDLSVMYDVDLPDDIEATPLQSLRPYILLSEDHPLAQEPALTLDLLAREDLILLEAPPTGEYVLSLFAERGLTPSVRYRCPSFELVRGLVGHGLGYAILSAKPASRHTYDGHALVTRPLGKAARNAHAVLARRRGAELPAAEAAFTEACQQIFA